MIQYNFVTSDEKLFNLMNKLDDQLRSADIEVMLSTVDFFVLVAEKLDGIREDVADRIRHTLFASLHDGQSIMSIGNEENVNWEYNFIILKTIYRLTKDNTYAKVFQNSTYLLIFRHHEPIYNLRVKLNIMFNITNTNN